MGCQDEWPRGPDGNRYDGKQLMGLLLRGCSPFRKDWDVNLLIQEIEEKLETRVTDIPSVEKGSNHYGFHLKVSNRQEVLARISRGDVNMPDFDGFPVHKQIPEVRFEAAVYHLLRTKPDVRASNLIYYRPPARIRGRQLTIPKHLTGRSLFVFEKAEGTNNVWRDISFSSKLSLLDQLACMRAALFRYDPPSDFAKKYLHERMFDFKPPSFALPIAPTREFWMHVLESKIRATIQNANDMIGWESDNETVGPVALAAKETILRAIPYIMPTEQDAGVALYRLVLEHGDFGTHNTTVTTGTNGQPLVTSLYDWETACIVPAMLSDPLVAVCPVDLTVTHDGKPCVTRIPHGSTSQDLETYGMWARHYIQKCYDHAPEYKVVISMARDVRYLWFALRDWRGGDSEEFFGGLGAWADKRMKDLGVS